ncbi:MAG: ABC transporter substrate-binding protein [Marinovum sp.]|nr:ABC transporter substrate-binding protein [Marinovum sp.]
MSNRYKAYLDAQTSKYATGRIDRRSFITSVVAAGVAVPAALGMASQVEAMTPNMGGDLKIGRGHGSTTDTLDPSTYENSFATAMGYLWGNHLIEVGPDGKLRGELAESWEPRNGGATWAFNLRPDVTFSNGKTVAPADVIATYNYHRDEDSKSAAKGLLTAVTNISAEGNSVVFDLDGPNADFPFIVTDYHLIIMPSKDGMVDPLSGIGTGGYVIETFEPGVRVLASKNPNYFKSNAAFVDSVEMLSIVDLTARQNALLSGQVHIIDRLDPKTVALFGRAPNVNIKESTGYLHYTFPMRLDVEPFGNRDLRLALKWSVNKQEMLDKILLGHGTIGNDHPISPSVPFWADLPQRDFDPEMAAKHYKASGHSGRIQISASDAAFAGAVDAAQLIQASAKEAGIDIEVVREPSDGYWSNVWNKKGWCACYWGGRPTQDWMYSSAYVDSTEWNDTAWKDTDDAKKFNSIVVAARAELDEVKRADMYKDAQMLIHEDGGAVVPMFANYIEGLSTKVAHPEQTASNWSMDGEKAPERWWIA